MSLQLKYLFNGTNSVWLKKKPGVWVLDQLEKHLKKSASTEREHFSKIYDKDNILKAKRLNTKHKKCEQILGCLSR